MLPRAVAALTLAAGLLPLPLVAPIATVAAATLPSGFTDEVLVSGLTNPTNIAFASDGRVFVAEKRGTVKTWPSYASLAAGNSPTTTIDLSTEVYNFWDRGLLGLTVDPGWPGRPYIYLLYTLDARPGDTPPHWNDMCPSPPDATTEGCVATGRLAKVTVNTSTGVSTNKVNLLGGATSGPDSFDWCQQFPSHSIGTVAFGGDGKLYVSAGEGASFRSAGDDWGQLGGTLPSTANPVTPANPCADPIDSSLIPPAQNPPVYDPAVQGGALRSQGVRSSRTQITLDGSILRLDPDTGAAASGNPLAGSSDPNRRRVVAYGFRNPFRFTFRPGTNEIWAGDVGNTDWEELNRITDPTTPAPTGPRNYGWPCVEGNVVGHYYSVHGTAPTLCSSIGTVTAPYWTYNHTVHQAPGDGCTLSAGSAIAGLAFHSGTSYPSEYANGLFAADYTRNCIVFLPNGSNGLPDPTQATPFEANAAGPVALVVAPDGNLLYPELCANPGDGTACAGGSGAIRRIRYRAPTASFTATPSAGSAPLHVSFDGSASSSPVGQLTYVWHFGDGSADTSPSTSPTTTHDYVDPGTYTARLTVTDPNDVTAQTTHQIAVGNTPPSVTITAPASSLTWKVGDTIHVAATATDTQDGSLSGSSVDWTVIIEHCPSTCHEHLLATFSGTSGTFTAPDHDYPTFLKILVTATDSGGLTASDEVDIQPRTSDITIDTSPAGLPFTFGSVGGTAPQTFTEIEGATRVLSATTPAYIGESEYRFSNWSDGMAATHNVVVPASDETLTATYTLVSSDASNTCSGASVRSSIGSWWVGALATGTDVDWFRFKTTTAGAFRAVLGDLPVGARLDLYKGCTTLLASSNNGGTSPEEILKTLAAGSYALKVSALGTGDSNATYKLRAQALGTSVRVLSTHVTTSPTRIRIEGEVLNGSASTRGPINLTAKLYNSSGHVVATLTGAAYRPVLSSLRKSAFVVTGNLPAGFDHATVSISSSARTSAAAVAPSLSGMSASSNGGGWVVTGKVRNAGTKTMKSVRVITTLYDELDNVMAVGYVAPLVDTLAAGVSSTYSVSFPGVTPSLTSVAARARY